MTENDDFNALLAAHVEDVQQTAVGLFQEQIALCESPIERRLFPHLFFLKPGWLAGRYGGPMDYGIEMRLEPQKAIGRYRVDFGLTVRPIWEERDQLYLAIECEGHDWHSSRGQKAYDDTRRRALIVAGWQVVPFTGSQINGDPAKCAAEVGNIIDAHFGGKIIAATMQALTSR